jgi:hypothetical protein
MVITSKKNINLSLIFQQQLTMRKLQVCGNRVFRKIFGPKKDEVTWQFSILHKYELRD